MHRRPLLLAGLGVLAAPALRAQEAWPSRPVTIVNGYPPGGITDTATRAIAERMQRELGQPIVVENRSGAATAVANAYVSNARPDGYTLLMGSTTIAINPALQPNLEPKDPLRQLVPIGLGYRSGFVLHVHPSLPVNTVQELIDYAKANPGKLNSGSSGIGATNHLCLELFRTRTGIDVLHVPYRGGAAALLDLRQNRIQMMFQAVQEALPTLRENVTRPLGVTDLKEEPLVPGTPPIANTLPGYNPVFWQGIFAPPGTPQPILDRVGAVLRVATEDPELRRRMAAQAVAIDTGDAAVMRGILENDLKVWGDLIRTANIRLE